MVDSVSRNMMKNLADGNPDGVTIGLAGTDPMSLYGKVPVTQQSAPTIISWPSNYTASASTLLASTQSMAWYATDRVNALCLIISNLGIVA